MNTLDLIRFIFGPDISEEEANSILWGCTGWPCFFSGKTSRTRQLYKQLSHAKRALARGFTIWDIYFGQDKLNQ